MPERYIIAHDLGTSSNKAVLTTLFGDIVKETKKTYLLYHPHPSHAEQDANEWFDAVCESTKELLKISKVKPEQIECVTFSSQTQCMVSVDIDGSPLRNAISWMDSRSADIINSKFYTPPKIMGYNPFKLMKFMNITGGAPGHNGKDQIGKLMWLKEYEPDVFHHTHKFVDAKDFLIYQLTGEWVTSVDLAYIWWLLDTRKFKNQWHSDLVKMAGIQPDNLSQVKESAAIAGYITKEGAQKCGLIEGIPVVNGAGDLAAGAVGSGALNENELILCLGTSAWAGAHVTRRKVDVSHYTGAIGSAIPAKYYLAMAHQQTAGACLEWLKREMFAHDHDYDIEDPRKFFGKLNEDMEQIPPGSDGLLFTPWMFGERCPIHDNYARAGFNNLNLEHTRKHIARAVIEGITYNLIWALETVENLFEKKDEIRVIGGGVQSDLWCQIISDVTNKRVHRVANPGQAGTKAIALMASLTLGHIKSFDELSNYIKINQTFESNSDNHKIYKLIYKEFKNVYYQNRKWFKRMQTLK